MSDLNVPEKTQPEQQTPAPAAAPMANDGVGPAEAPSEKLEQAEEAMSKAESAVMSTTDNIANWAARLFNSFRRK